MESSAAFDRAAAPCERGANDILRSTDVGGVQPRRMPRSELPDRPP
jgi:hypothetical protein